MNRLILSTFVALYFFAYPTFAAEEYSSAYADPSGICEEMCYTEFDFFGEILGTLPSAAPGTGNSWVGETFLNGELIQLKNVTPTTSAPQFLRFNPNTGSVIATVTLPFTGYIMGATSDGVNLWVVRWFPADSSRIFCVTTAGVIVSSFDPNTLPFSARSIAWDGQYLWVGCNQSANHTKLVKFSTSGQNLQEWVTDSLVGWYMDSEFSDDFPLGEGLCLVDNIGNTFKRLGVRATVEILDLFPSPAMSPDVAEGLAFDYDYLWHNGAYSTQGVRWRIDDGFTPQPLLDILLLPVTSPPFIPPGGGTLYFDANVINHAFVQQRFWVWTRMKYPDGTWSNPMLGPLPLNPPLEVWITRLRSQNIPASYAPGNYCYAGYVNWDYTYPPVDSSYFAFTKSATGDNNLWITEAICTGEPFLGEDVPPLIPRRDPPAGGKGDRGDLVTASPNPFNPSTTIRYELRAASNVSLKVYDTAGRLVTTLVNGYCDAGPHQVTFNGSNHASGIYLYTLNIGSQTITGKMMLLK